MALHRSVAGRLRPRGRHAAAALVALLGLAAPADAAFPGPNGSVAFARDVGGSQLQIYAMEADGSRQTRLTRNGASDYEPAFSSAGTQIAFTSNRDGNPELYVMGADGSGQSRLTNNTASDFQPAFSPDGTRIAFVSNRSGTNEIYVMNVDGSGQTRLTTVTSPFVADFNPVFSPDGTKIAFESSRDELSGEVYVMAADGSRMIRLTSNTSGDHAPAFSPDGSLIAFESDRDGDSEIYTMSPSGLDQVNRTNNMVPDGRPAFSPDGSQIAFESDRDGNPEIYTMSAGGSGQRNLTNASSSADFFPDWGIGAAPSPVYPAPPDVTKPILSSLSLSRSRFRAARRGPSISARVGTKVSYALSEPAWVTFRVERALHGRRVGGRCVRPRRSNRKRRRCTRHRTLRGSFTHPGTAGQNSFKFSGRLRGRKLRPGRYRLRAVATDAAQNRSSRKRVRFRIVRR